MDDTQQIIEEATDILQSSKSRSAIPSAGNTWYSDVSVC